MKLTTIQSHFLDYKIFFPSIYVLLTNWIFTSTQDYVGGAIVDTNACRMLLYSIAQGLDQVTENSDWNIYSGSSQPVFRFVLTSN